MRALLICEGRCNPTRTAIEAEVRRFRYRNGPTDRTVRPPAALLAELHALVHTSHTFVGTVPGYRITADVWRCQVCGSERVYGAHITGLAHVA